MEIKGIIVSGMGKGTYFMSQDIYKKKFEEKLNFTPFVGTLNIGIDVNEIRLIKSIPQGKFDVIKGEGKFGDVKLVKAILNDEVEGAIVFPVKTKHPEDVLEFISAKKLRESLKLEDGDIVTLKI
jgi:riboflavin kinase, archaea type